MSAAERLAARLAALRESAAFRNYLEVRDAVLRLKDQAGTAGEPSRYWQEELAGFEYLLDASPLVVEKLLHHSYHLTGLKVYDYRSGKEAAQRQFEEKLAALIELGGRDLLVPQPRALGGFGFEIDGALYNIDTLKFFEVLIGMRRAGVLPPADGERRCLLEVGAGWGGFAHAYKTLRPDTTYVIVDLPEVLLFSGTYIRTVFPAARLHFHDAADPIPKGRWRDYDFVLLPNTALDQLRPDRLDLVVNMVSFQEMTAEQCLGYVAKAAALHCPVLYSLNRDRSPYNPQMTAVSELIGEHYDTEEVALLDVPYTKMLQPTGRKKKDGERTERSYRHLVGRRRAAAPGAGGFLRRLFG
ncbi:putative sugar O-methyltransferase [Tistlia consotensis]|uniref:Putative sugar O-methyltransferase n=1 Tax=Tistlia consotensis USBA 355 TaxID=560819 RepID=A0A1Y6B8Z7_9PROT|nr:putative sugar O-methyltransferase [Tistlia consotensis]SME99096.1 putative sugar O-methyltransferase [Tistlia consotensis USBA 355]SNR77364.1 putative sugar O-methyltransferase [Tistlia consotensis]